MCSKEKRAKNVSQRAKRTKRAAAKEATGVQESDEPEVPSRQTDRGAEDLGKAKTLSDDADEQENREVVRHPNEEETAESRNGAEVVAEAISVVKKTRNPKKWKETQDKRSHFR